MSNGNSYLGKFRGTVVNNVDPMRMGRLQVMVPDVSGVALSSWAMPCVPVAGIQTGFFSVPIIGAGVWIEFERGDADYPIWVGAFWGSGAELPATAQTIPPAIAGMTYQTPLQNSLTISDVPGVGGILARTATGASIMANETGIHIQNGQGASISLVGPTVTINAGALVIT